MIQKKKMNAEIKPVTGLLPTAPPDLAKSKKAVVPLGSLLAFSRRQECLPGRPWGAGPILRNPAASLDPRSALRRATSKLLAEAHTAGGSNRSSCPCSISWSSLACATRRDLNRLGVSRDSVPSTKLI